MYKSFKKIVVLTLVILLVTITESSVKAETVDDLRDLVGNPRASSEESRAEIKTFLSVYGQAELKGELTSMLDTIEKDERAKSDKKLLELEAKKAKEEQNLLSLISKDEDVMSILSIVNTLESIESDIDDVTIKPVNIMMEDEITKDYSDKYDYIQSLLASIENDYTIGDIGRGLKPPTDGMFKLADAFGVYLDSATNTKKVNNRGVRLIALKYKDTAVKSQWNGKVKEIKNGKITIKHGTSLVTIYSKVKDVKVGVGDKVKQYEILGSVDGESLYFEIKLDTYYIDPMMVYGAEGVEAYYNWVAANPSRIITINDVSSFKNKEDAVVEVETKDNTKVTTNDDGSINAALPDNYVAPNTGVLN